MKIRNFFVGAAAALAMLVGCQEKEQNLGTPEITISESEMTFEVAGGDQDLTVTATRDWKVENDAEWVVVSPSSGAGSVNPQTVTVSVLANEGLDRTADLVFTIGLKKKYLTVYQAGPGGSAEALIVYKNDFDIEKAQNNSGWPYLDSNYNLWDNKKGTGASTVVYEFGGKMSVRTSGKASNDGSGYSHYAGSGANKVFFGTAPSTFKITKITLDGTKTDFALSFGGQKYLQDGDSNFSWGEFKAYVSNDAQKWVELAMAFPADADINGDWNLASANFTVPAGTTELGVAFVSTASSAYSIDDVLLEVASESGQTIDFSAGTTLDGTTPGEGGNTGGDTPTPPAGEATMTIAEVLAYGAALPSDAVIEGVVISNMDLNNLTSKKGMYVQDETAALQFYLAENHTFAMGDKVQINLAGVTVGEYNGAVQISGLALSKIAKVSSGNTVAAKTVTMEDFLANKYEGQYIALEGVQVIADDMTKTFVMGGAHTSITMEDASGNTFVVFSSKYSTYGATAVPQGSGVIKGISSINNGAMQLIFSQATDYAGLTGARFDGLEVTPPAEGGDDNGETPTPPAGEAGQFDSNITWTLGEKAYDKTSGSNAQYGTVNGVEVSDMLKLGTSKLAGDAVLHVPAGTKKLGFYCVAWSGKKANVKFSIAGTEVATIAPAANSGATGNPPYTITLADSDYYEVEMPSTDAADVKVETLDASNGRAIFIGIKAVTE